MVTMESTINSPTRIATVSIDFHKILSNDFGNNVNIIMNDDDDDDDDDENDDDDEDVDDNRVW